MATSLPAPAVAAITPGRIHLGLTRVADGLSSPLLVTNAGDGSGRLFVVEQTGKIEIIKAGKVLATPFLDLSGSVSQGGEQGLLGLAFHPTYKSNGKLYVSYTDRNGTSVIREYRVSASNPDRVDTSSGRTILSLRQPFANHNGGNIAFGPDGDLYIGFGDGGSAGDPGNRAQNLNVLLGKLLRIDVNRRTGTLRYGIPPDNPFVGRSGLDQIWAYGLRNPWRWSFDRATGDLWIGDVGQNACEEVDRALASHGRNAGRGAQLRLEGDGRQPLLRALERLLADRQDPAVDRIRPHERTLLDHRRIRLPRRQPTRTWSARTSSPTTAPARSGTSIAVRPAARPRSGPWTRTLQITSFGQDQAGELYLTDGNGSVYRVTDS